MGFLATFLRRLFTSRELLVPGTRAPDFEALDDRGRTVRLADFRGRRVVLWFFPRAGTPHCTRQGCAYAASASAYAARGAQVLGASFDDPARNRRFAAQHGFPYPLLSDTDRRIAIAYRAAQSARDAFPRRVTYVIGPDGLVEQALETKDPGAQAGALLESLGD